MQRAASVGPGLAGEVSEPEVAQNFLASNDNTKVSEEGHQCGSVAERNAARGFAFYLHFTELRINYPYPKIIFISLALQGADGKWRDSFSFILYFKSVCRFCILSHHMAELVLVENNVFNY